MQIAPYDDQMNLLHDRFDVDLSTRGVAVGNADRFQGRKAGPVLFSITSSHADHMPRILAAGRRPY